MPGRRASGGYYTVHSYSFPMRAAPGTTASYGHVIGERCVAHARRSRCRYTARAGKKFGSVTSFRPLLTGRAIHPMNSQNVTIAFITHDLYSLTVCSTRIERQTFAHRPRRVCDQANQGIRGA
ncbi:hypothetical protein BVI434_2650002 [Burkholderia vietnamiensis]|nr:hypothetical protein BVI434_2650002 [Burkholderia vietnamiensis]